MKPIAKRSRKFHQISHAYGAQDESHLEPVSFPQKLPRCHNIESAARRILVKNRVAGHKLDLLCGSVEQIGRFGRARQQFRQGMSRCAAAN